MKKVRSLVAAIGLFALSACATPVTHNTASGRAETVFHGAPDVTKGKIITMMVNHGFSISKDTSYLVAFDKPTSNIAVSVMLGSNLDPTVNVRATFTMVPLDTNTRVVLDYSYVTNPGSAFEKITPSNGNVDTGQIQIAMDKIAAQ